MLPAALLLVLAGADAGPGRPEPSAPPKGLSCLPRWYAGEVVYSRDAGWGFALPGDAGVVPWEDGVVADGGEENAEESPDLHDVFAVPYPKGPIVPVTGDGGIEDPGRARIEQLFKTTYGSTSQQVRDHLAKVRVFGLRYPFHERAAPALERVMARLEAAVQADPKLLPNFKTIGGTFIWRRIARSKSLSTHSWGIAIDLNVERSTYWRWTRPREPIVWRNKLPQAVVDAFEAEGFIWGGRWLHYDTMHFEYRPELVDPACR